MSAGEQTTLKLTRRDPLADITWTGGLPPFQLQGVPDLGSGNSVANWINFGKPTLARSKEVVMDGVSGFFRVQSEVPQFDVDLTSGQTRLFWSVPELAPGPPAADIFNKPFPGVKDGWVEDIHTADHPETWNYTANPITGRPSVGFHWGDVRYAASGHWEFPQHQPEVFVTYLFKSLRNPPRNMEVMDLYDTNEVCNTYQYVPGELVLFMRDGYGGMAEPIPQNIELRVWLHYKMTPTGATSELCWALRGQAKPTSGPRYVTGHMDNDPQAPHRHAGPIQKVLLGPVEGDAVFVYADLQISTFFISGEESGGNDAIDHFRLSRRVPEGPWEILADLIPFTTREYLDNMPPEPIFDYTLRGYTTLGEEWDYAPIIRVEEVV